jgi:DNA repair protein RecN (Recombination protein N)
MLLNLRIRDFAIIDEAEIEFGAGFTVVTGETGAGKSILINALTIALGGRASASSIRSGAASAQVEALFDISGHPRVKERLGERELVGDDENLLLVRRVVAAKGRGKVLINERLSTVATLAELVRGLVDISGQNDQQSLLLVENHGDILDSFGETGGARAAYGEAWAGAHRVARELKALQRSEDANLQQLDYLSFQLAEIERLAPCEGEDEALAQEIRRLSSAEKLQTGSRLVEHLLYSEDGSAFDKVGKALAEIEQLSEIDDALAPSLEGLESARREIEEAARTLGIYSERVESDAGRLEDAESRLAAIKRLCRKHGGSLEDVLARQTELQSEIHGLENSDIRMNELEATFEGLKVCLLREGEKLTGERRKAAAVFADAICDELKDMELERAVFEVQVAPRPQGGEGIALSDVMAGPQGLDDIEFLWSANTGEELRPLNKTASGGELSRLMLAVKHVLCNHDLVSLYVFDEVDTGLGGKAADSIGRKIQDVATGHQAITITHLASIASRADHHLYVSKATQGKRTVSGLELIEGARRVEELARMIDGASENDATLGAAAEMLERAGRERAA